MTTWDPNAPSKTRDRLKIEWWLADNEREREERRDRIAQALGRPTAYWHAEQIIALSTGLEALYDLGEPQDEIICQWMRKHPHLTIEHLIERATWVFVAK